ncbi:glutamate receptor ionotropic, delta-2-like [Homarus americanus]|uniref:glutamate receptor ionotropic, delta-2-like n=1 Tax=Homarus americanus TaxID=6706 RepID=UPI001C470845|nr:glutamate receptor ionotropic, delta-2-like [Homarus americanus]
MRVYKSSAGDWVGSDIWYTEGGGPTLPLLKMKLCWSLVLMIGLTMTLQLPQSQSQLPQSHPELPESLPQLVAQFIKELENEYFQGCTTVIFHETPTLEGRQGGIYIDSGSDLMDQRALMDYGSFMMGHFLSTRGSPWIIFNLGHNLSNVLLDTDLNTVMRCPVYVTLARDISHAQNLFLQTNRDWDKYFLSRKHLIVTESETTALEEFLKLEEINTMSNLLFVRPGVSSSTLKVFTNTPYGLPSPRSLLTWRAGLLVTKDKKDLFPDKLMDFHGRRMRVVTFHFPPRIFMEEQEDGEHLLYGVDIEVVRALSEAVNFSVSFSRPSDGEMWGWEQDNGSWTGLMGDLQYRQADIGVADLYIMEQYFAIIDMSQEYDIEYLCFVNLVPGPLPQWMALGLPFLLETWVAIFISVLAGMLMLVGITRLGFIINLKEGQAQEVPWFRHSANICLLLYACVMNTSWMRVPTASHLRIFVFLWSMAFIILAVAYKGSLVSYLTVHLEQPPIDTHRQLHEKDVDVGSIGYTLKRVMEKNADPYVRFLAERYQHVPSTSEGLQRTVQGRYSFLESRGFLDYTIAVDYTDRRGKASLHVMREYIAPFGIGLAYPKYVPYIAKFNTIISRLH